MIRPNKIIHLAALSESETIMKDPFETIYINGVVICKICDIIHKHKLNTKLFNTCSSEMFKGHKNYLVVDYDKNFNPTYPYSYGKILGYYMIEYYRKKYNYCFSNGILFPTESTKRKSGFLFRKIKDHIGIWKEKKETLKLGNLYSHRNMLHVEDVINAIHIILLQEKGDDYVICSDHTYLLLDIIKKFYENNGIKLIQKDNNLMEENNIVITFEKENGSEVNIDGSSEKLKNLGWIVEYDLEHILNSI